MKLNIAKKQSPSSKVSDNASLSESFLVISDMDRFIFAFFVCSHFLYLSFWHFHVYCYSIEILCLT